MPKVPKKKRKYKPMDLFFSRIGGIKIRVILADFNDKKKAIKSRLNTNPEQPLKPQERERMIDKLYELDESVNTILTIYKGNLDDLPDFKGLTVDVLEPMLQEEIDVSSPYKVFVDYPELASFYFNMGGEGLLKKDFPSLSEVLRDFPELAKHFIYIPDTNLRGADKEGNTPLHYAMKSGHEENTKSLLKTKAYEDFNTKNNKGETPLQLATPKIQEYIEKKEGENSRKYVNTFKHTNTHNDLNPCSLSSPKIAALKALNFALNHHYGIKTIQEESKSSHIKPTTGNKRRAFKSRRSRIRYTKRRKKSI